MQSGFAIVVLAVGVVGVLGAVLALLTGRRAWEQLDRDRLLMESDRRDTGERAAAGRALAPASPVAPAADAERDAELRQMLQARNARRRRRGEPELDAEAEIARLTRDTGGGRPSSPHPGEVDPELAGEIRELVIARNHRRARRGKPPLDVEAEVARELARLGPQSG